MNHQQDGRILTQAIVESFKPRLEISQVEESRWEFGVSGGDQYGDPLWFSITLRGKAVTIDDGGAVAGLLFALEQDEEGAPAYELLASLAHRHDLRIDYDNGLLQKTCPPEKVCDELPVFTRIVLSILTAAPHLESVVDAAARRKPYAAVN